jgi:UDP-sulfoquinovose synthase
VIGHPLTVYGKGTQTRGYLNIKDTLNCVKLSLESSPKRGELRIFNQFTETFSVNELAEKVRGAGKKMGLDVKINKIENPRKENEEHYYNPKHTGLLDLGLKPHFLSDGELIKIMKLIVEYKNDIATDKIFFGTKWSKQ